MKMIIVICSVLSILLFSGCAGVNLPWDDIATNKITMDDCSKKYSDNQELEECKLEIAAAKRAKQICDNEPYNKEYCYSMARDSWKNFVFIMDTYQNLKPNKNFVDTYPIMCWGQDGKVTACQKSKP